MIFSLLYIITAVVIYHYAGVSTAGLVLCIMGIVNLFFQIWKKRYNLDTLASPLFAIVLGICAFFVSDFIIIKLYPLLISLVFWVYFVYAVITKKYPLVTWVEKFKKRQLSNQEMVDIKKSHFFWVIVLGINTLIHLYLVLYGSVNEWALYSFVGWYLYFGIAMAIQLSFVYYKVIFQWLRNIWGYGLFVFVIIIAFIFGVSSYYIFKILSKPKPHVIFQSIVAMMFRVFFRNSPGVKKLSLIKSDEIKSDKPYIYIASHQSWLDYPLMGAFIVDLFHLTNKKKAFVWYLRFTARLLGVIDGIGNQALYILLQKLRNGSNVLIFPEGSRSIDGKIGNFKNGAFALSIKSDIEVVPVLISGTRLLVKKGSLNWLENKNVTIEVKMLPPIKANPSEDVTSFANRVRDIMLQNQNNHSD
ncbi:MAG: lysophospholipid acyltransferase family protein [Sulfurovaceae bacterium]|nr:lysophospholipid acyltransferase family protein [Sulfurovaceae bacterium]